MDFPPQTNKHFIKIFLLIYCQQNTTWWQSFFVPEGKNWFILWFYAVSWGNNPPGGDIFKAAPARKRQSGICLGATDKSPVGRSGGGSSFLRRNTCDWLGSYNRLNLVTAQICFLAAHNRLKCMVNKPNSQNMLRYKKVIVKANQA